ncbi:MAG TPA: hypothetical protein VGQ82_08675, partial [Chthoniobacterales bacterium]|nr:hypothetical protein [Chthoniobacterales bacterium]
MRVLFLLFVVFASVSSAQQVKKALPPPTSQSTPKPAATAPPKPLVAVPFYDEETSTRLQIFLDNNDFGPGKIDGKMGEFF